MARGKKDLEMARTGYRDAKNRGDHEEEARWANQMGHLLKERGEYVEALKWFRIDYDLSLKHLPQKQLMPTCQSIGEMYLRLERFEDALAYQKKHLEFAQEVEDLVEQQRASTQLGRTFFDIYEKDDANYSALKKAKKYLNMSMELARTLKENPPTRNSPSFVKELVDAYNNMGLLKIYLEDYKQAERVLMEGLKICDDEEVGDNDDGRTRLHHNLGRIYIEKKEWEKAKEHINIDIAICQNIPHPQGEANGLINLGVIHFKLQKYENALQCYNRALRIACSLEDEDALIQHIKQNIRTTEEAQKLMNDLIKEEQHLKKLARIAIAVKGTAAERRYHIEQHKSLKRLLELSIDIEAWNKHLEFAKRNKNVVNELGDKEKLGDALLAIGESYYNLRKFDKAKKWYTKSWKVCKSIGNLEGQAIAKINLGNALDSAGNWNDALEAYQEGYKTAVEGKVLSSQITALQNMHYSYMLRFDNLEDARKLEPDIERLKSLVNEKEKDKDSDDERCSETDSAAEHAINLSDDMNVDSSFYSPSQKSAGENHMERNCADNISGWVGNMGPIEDDLPLASYVQSCKQASQKRTTQQDISWQNTCQKPSILGEENDSQDKVINNLIAKANVNQQLVARKRPRIVLSDDEKSDESGRGYIVGRTEQGEACASYIADVQKDVLVLHHEGNTCHLISKRKKPDTGDANCIQTMCSKENMSSIQNLAEEYNRANDEVILKTPLGSHEGVGVSKDPSQLGDDVREICTAFNPTGCYSKDAISGDRKQSLVPTSIRHGVEMSMLPMQARNSDAVIPVRIDATIIKVNVRDSNESDLKTINCLKVEVAHLFCLQLHNNNKSSGMKPIVQHLVYNDNILEPTGLVKDLMGILGPEDMIEAVIDGWVRMPLVERYLIFCKGCSQKPNAKLLSKLHSLKVSEDEVVASDCELQDVSVLPLLRALREDGTFSLLDLSHNSLGNQTVHGIQEMIAASNKKDLGLTLDLHHNQLGASSLIQICQCPVSFSRLEVLNLSGNRLTDACARHLSMVVEECKALAILNLEGCALTTRAIQRIANALPFESGLVKLSIGKNNPISGAAMADLLKKLSMLKSFSDLDMTNIELNKTAIEALCYLLQMSSSISALAVGGTHIETDGALKLSGTMTKRTMVLTKLDMSFCGIDNHGGSKLCRDFILYEGLLHLSLSGNQLEQEGANVLGQLLANARCHLKTLLINKCHLGQAGILKIIQSLQENRSLKELGLAGNNIVENNSTANIFNGADRSATARCIEETMIAHNYHGECSENRASDRSNQHESPTSVSSQRFNAAEDQRGRSLIPQNETMPCAGDKTESNKEQDILQSRQQYERNCNEYDVADSEDEGKPEGANCSSLEDDCASSSQPFVTIRGKYHLLPALQPNGTVSTKRELNAASMSLEEFASELFSSICMAKNLQLLDLSDNFLPSEIAEQLYIVWSSYTRAGSPAKHIENHTVHFCMEGRPCCGFRTCCQRD
eukprot:Gb_06807 [translate_table: standard]